MTLYGVQCKNILQRLSSPLLSYRHIRKMSSVGDKFQLPAKYRGSENNVWGEYIALNAQYKPLNLGQGFPDYFPPDHVTQNLSKVAISTDNALIHQYTRGYGHPRLVTILSKLYSKMIDRTLDPLKELIVTNGAYEALYCSILGNIHEGDEVILIEPFFDCYAPMVKSAGGTAVYIPLRPTKTNGIITSGDWKLDPEELKNKFNKNTKAIIFNTPHNPLGKVFTRDEMTVIAELCKKWNVICISDEVYEWMVFEPFKHIRMATLPGMWERTITIGSAGKTFSVTGWKTGWAYGPDYLLKNLFVVHQNCINSCITPVQEAIAQSLEFEFARYGQPECYLQSLAVELVQKRDYMAQFLSDVGMVPIIPEGGYFMMADWSPLSDKVKLEEEADEYKDYRFTKWMTRNVSLLGIPPSAFYCEQDKHLAENFVRYCFIKKDENLSKAENILKTWINNSKLSQYQYKL